MHVVHVIRDLDSASGGPSRSLPALLRSLARTEPQLRATALYQDRGQAMTVDAAEESTIQFLPVAGGSASGPIRLRRRLDQVNQREPIDLIHLHGIWSPSIHFSAGYARGQGIPYLMTPRGMLSTWCLNNKSMRKRVAWWSYQQRDLQQAACIHATSKDESADVRSSGLTPPIATIPHGCNLPPTDLSQTKSNPRLAVCISRIHPVKGLEDLLDAWARVQPLGWQLVIAGPDSSGYSEQLRAQIKRHHVEQSVNLIDAVDGEQKWHLLSRADFFVSASHSENFGMSIAESLAAATPVITTHGTPWQSLVDRRCGWWVPVGSGGLSSAIAEAISLPSEELAKMGERGAELIRSEFSWNAIANRTAAVYRWLLNRSGELPRDLAESGQGSQIG